MSGWNSGDTHSLTTLLPIYRFFASSRNVDDVPRVLPKETVEKIIDRFPRLQGSRAGFAQEFSSHETRQCHPDIGLREYDRLLHGFNEHLDRLAAPGFEAKPSSIAAISRRRLGDKTHPPVASGARATTAPGNFLALWRPGQNAVENLFSRILVVAEHNVRRRFAYRRDPDGRPGYMWPPAIWRVMKSQESRSLELFKCIARKSARYGALRSSGKGAN